MGAEHRVLFAPAAEHLIARRILLPGYSTLWRLVGAAREHADARGYRMLAETPTAEQRERLQALLHTPTGRRLSALERLRRPEVEPTIGGLIGGLARVRELRALADGLGGVDGLPVARLRALTVDAERTRPADISKMGDVSDSPRCQRQRTRRENRDLKFYELRDNLWGVGEDCLRCRLETHTFMNAMPA